MDTQKREKHRFIILIPHRDICKPFGEYRQKLFAEGFSGAYSFPMAAPLAEVSRPFSRAELKELAGNIRKCTEKNDGKIRCSGTALIMGNREWGIGNGHHCSQHERIDKVYFSFFGSPLDLPINESLFPQSAGDKNLRTYVPYVPLLPPVLCAALVSPEINPARFSPGEQCREEAPAFSFRAASLANLVIRPLAGGDPRYSFEWKIGPPVWLPKYNKEHFQ